MQIISACLGICSENFQFSIMYGFSIHSIPSSSPTYSFKHFFQFFSFRFPLSVLCAYASSNMCMSVLALPMTTSNVIRIMLGFLTVDYFPFSCASFSKPSTKESSHILHTFYLSLSLSLPLFRFSTHASNLLCLRFLFMEWLNGIGRQYVDTCTHTQWLLKYWFHLSRHIWNGNFCVHTSTRDNGRPLLLQISTK